MKIETSKLSVILRRRKIRGGIVALKPQLETPLPETGQSEHSTYFSPSLSCNTMNEIMSRTNPSNKPHTFGLDHGYWMPPHCSARNKQTMLDMKSTVPIGSISLIFSLKSSVEGCLFGVWKASRNTTAEINPNAFHSLIHKHSKKNSNFQLTHINPETKSPS